MLRVAQKSRLPLCTSLPLPAEVRGRDRTRRRLESAVEVAATTKEVALKFMSFRRAEAVDIGLNLRASADPVLGLLQEQARVPA